jgi:hypothetical protein
MTTRTVQVDVSAPGTAGPVPLTAGSSVQFTLTQRLKAGTTLIVPESVSADVGTSIDLEVTPAGWAYRVTITTPQDSHGPIYVLVNPGATTNLVDLPVVDPKTLDVVDPGPAWWAVADGIVAARDDAEAAATSAGQSASAAAQSATAADGSATTASTKAGEASSSASDASTSASTASTKAGEASTSATNANNSATSAGQAKTAAEAARDQALAQTFGGVDLGTTDLNTLTTPGIGRQASSANATLARNYPLANFIGTVEVLRSSDPAFPTSGLTQRATPIWSSGSGVLFWIRRKQASGDAWSPWKPIVTQRTDKTAGLAIYTWDDVAGREQLVYGDTGLRDISSLLDSSLYASGSVLFVRRKGYEVTLQGAVIVNADMTTENNLIPSATGWPAGFGVQAQIVPRIPFRMSAAAVYHNLRFTSGVVQVSPMGTITNAQGSFAFLAKYDTAAAWPATLPGTPSGTIPNT